MIKPILIILVLIGASDSWACSCRIGDAPTKYENHVSIFGGKVAEIIFYEERDASGDHFIKVTFEIEKQWKGEPNQNVLLTVYNGFSCYGYWFKEGENYIVYAFDNGDSLNAWWCGGVISESDEPKNYKSEARVLNRLSR